MTAGRYVGLLLTLQLAAGCSQQPDAPPVEQAAPSVGKNSAAPQADERLVLAFGDSLYAGYGVEQAESFPSVLERELDRRGTPTRVVNAGVSGETTAGGRARLAFALDGLPRSPDLVLVGLGANDALRGLDPAETRANLDAILAELNRRNIAVLLTGMMAPRNMDGTYIRSFDRIYPDLAKKHGAALDPFFMQGIITEPAMLLNDGLHPNAAGIQKMAQRIALLAEERLKSM